MVEPRTRKQLDASDRDVLEHLCREASEFLAAGALQQAQATVLEAEAMAPDDADVLVLRAELLMLDGKAAQARDLLERALSDAPAHADAHHLLARAYEATDRAPEMIEHDLRVLELDEAADLRDALGTPADLAFIEKQAREALASLPADLRDRLQGIPVVLEARPHRGIVSEGFDPRALGLFEGPDDARRRSVGDMMPIGVDAIPTRIVLFYANLLASCADDEELADQVVITVLHEIGHFFGLDEVQVEKLGLA